MTVPYIEMLCSFEDLLNIKTHWKSSNNNNNTIKKGLKIFLIFYFFLIFFYLFHCVFSFVFLFTATQQYFLVFLSYFPYWFSCVFHLDCCCFSGICWYCWCCLEHIFSVFCCCKQFVVLFSILFSFLCFLCCLHGGTKTHKLFLRLESVFCLVSSAVVIFFYFNFLFLFLINNRVAYNKRNGNQDYN